MNTAKPFNIDKDLVWQAWLAVKANRGAAGVDGITVKDFERDLEKNLYKIWNRLSSGCYLPPPVKRVDIPKSDGKTRPLGIPTVADRVAQMTVKLHIEPQWDALFHPSSFGYRKGKSAHEAVAQARLNCWKYGWIIDLDIKGFFDNIDHQLMLKAVRLQSPPRWAEVCIERWLKAEVRLPDGKYKVSDKGTPQGGVISPLLANLFLHYAHDKWMERKYPHLPFERYADDAVIHCRSQQEAKQVLESLKQRMLDCGLELHPEKTRIVCCEAQIPREPDQHNEFDFLGFTFCRRTAKRKKGGLFTSFLPAISKKAQKSIADTMRSWSFQRKGCLSIDTIAHMINPRLRGWITYYGKFYPSEMRGLWRILDGRFAQWVIVSSKRYRRYKSKAFQVWEKMKQGCCSVLSYWKVGYVKSVE